MYNVEVEAEHRYFVGSGEVLTHNSCDVSPTASGKEGVIYHRDGGSDDEYVGQAESKERYIERQQEHRDANPGKDYKFTELKRVPQGGKRTLDVTGEDWIRAGGDPKKQGGRLENSRYQMNDKKYKSSGGKIGKPTQPKPRTPKRGKR